MSDTVDISIFSLTPATAAAVTYTEQPATAVTINSGLTVTDSVSLTSATVAIGTGFLATDVLAASTTGTSISESYNSASGMLTLSGTDSVAHYQQVLELGDLQLDGRGRAQRGGEADARDQHQRHRHRERHGERKCDGRHRRPAAVGHGDQPDADTSPRAGRR